MGDYKIAIPSYKRPDNQKTYALLEKIGAPMEKVYVFVQNQEDYESYQSKGIENLIFHQKKTNVAGNRNNVLNYFPEGEKIVMIDDDCKCFLIKDGEKARKIERYEELDRICELGWKLCRKYRSPVWGINQSCNGLYLNNTVSTKAMVSVMFGIINTDIRFNEKLPLLEDTEFCCQVVRRYHAIPRINACGVDNAREIGGGCKEWYEKGLKTESVRYLLTNYSDLLKQTKNNRNQLIKFK